MAATSNLLSQTLQSITNTKMREQDRRRRVFKASRSKVLASVADTQDGRRRLQLLLSGYKDLALSNRSITFVAEDRNNIAQNMTRYLEQTRYDPSISTDVVQSFERSLEKKLEQESQRFKFADLYYRLLAEWTSAKGKPMEQSEVKDNQLDGTFEHVSKYDLQKLQDKFASVVFTPLETDEAEIENYLGALFEDDHAQSLLNRIREENNTFAGQLKEQKAPFDSHMLKQCIRALLGNNLLNNDAKNTLSDLQTNEIVLTEIADVLNLRFADLDGWSWDRDDGMYYEPRQQINGKYRIMMDMDILQAIFLHYIAISWCAHLKSEFARLAQDDKFWRRATRMTAEATQRQRFFANEYPSSSNGAEHEKEEAFIETFLNSSMPSSLTDGGDPYGEDQATGEGTIDEEKTGLGRRQVFLRRLAADVLIRRSLHGEVAVVQSDLQCKLCWEAQGYATGLPHSTLWAVLRFWGIPEDFITFFKKYAEAPLRMTASPGEDVRIRKRGIPITDAFEILFGETVLFCMDVAVNRMSGLTLTRFHDDLYMHGAPSEVAHAWQLIETFVKILGLDINKTKTGSVYISDASKDAELENKFPEGPVCMGMLRLSDNGSWTIDQDQVAAHTRQLQKQLGQCSSIMSWIQTWNACMGRFFQDTFGKPANCFGQAHVDAILETHAKMQRDLFQDHGGNVTAYLRSQIASRFGDDDVPDSFFFLPEEFGGLGVKNPFIPFLALKNQVLKDPQERIEQFHRDEKRAYAEAKKEFEALTAHAKDRRLLRAFAIADKQEKIAVLEEDFFSFEEFSSLREVYSGLLLSTFRDLMLKPSVQHIKLANDVAPWFEELQHTHGQSWHGLSNEIRWIMHLYAEELKQRFGALSIVDRNLLPGGVMKILKGEKVTWQLVIWE